MKKTFLLFILLIGFASVKAQLPADANTAILANIEALNAKTLATQEIAQIKLIQMTAMEVAKTSTQFIDNINSLQLLAQLLTDFVCQTDELALYCKASVNINNCFMNLQYNMGILNLTYSTDILKTVFMVTDLITMSSSERTSFIKTTIDALQKSMDQLNQLRNMMRAEITKSVVTKYVTKEQQQMGKTFSYSRYGK